MKRHRGSRRRRGAARGPTAPVPGTECQALAWAPQLAVNQDVGRHPVYVAAIPGRFHYRTLPPNAAGRQGRWLVMAVGRVNGSVMATVLLSRLPAPLVGLGSVTHVDLPAVRYPLRTDGPVVCPAARCRREPGRRRSRP